MELGGFQRGSLGFIRHGAMDEKYMKGVWDYGVKFGIEERAGLVRCFVWDNFGVIEMRQLR